MDMKSCCCTLRTNYEVPKGLRHDRYDPDVGLVDGSIPEFTRVNIDMIGDIAMEVRKM